MHAIDLRLNRDIHNIRIEIESDRSQSLLRRYLIDNSGVLIIIDIVSSGP